MEEKTVANPATVRKILITRLNSNISPVVRGGIYSILSRLTLFVRRSRNIAVHKQARFMTGWSDRAKREETSGQKRAQPLQHSWKLCSTSIQIHFTWTNCPEAESSTWNLALITLSHFYERDVSLRVLTKRHAKQKFGIKVNFQKWKAWC